MPVILPRQSCWVSIYIPSATLNEFDNKETLSIVEAPREMKRSAHTTTKFTALSSSLYLTGSNGERVWARGSVAAPAMLRRAV